MSDDQLGTICATGKVREQDAAWAILYPRMTAKLTVHARALRNEPDVADDLVQETLVRAWEHRTSFRLEKGGYMGWVKTILHRQYHSLLKKEHVRSGTAAIESRMDGGVGVWYGSPQGDMDDIVHASSVRERLAPLLGRLRVEEREVLLVWATGGSLEDFAAERGQKSSTIRSALFRAQKKLRTEYVQSFGVLHTEAL